MPIEFPEVTILSVDEKESESHTSTFQFLLFSNCSCLSYKYLFNALLHPQSNRRYKVGAKTGFNLKYSKHRVRVRVLQV